MPLNLRHRSFLKELDFTPAELRFLLGLAAEVKRTKSAHTDSSRLRGRNIALVFEEVSTSARCAFEVAAHDEGAYLTYVNPLTPRLGFDEPVEDTARVLGRLYDGIDYYGSSQATVEALAHYAGVPVWNGLTDEWHPMQTLCDLMTMREHSSKDDEELSVAFCGDARNGLANSLLVASAMLGMDVRIVAPQNRWNYEHVIKEARRLAEVTGARITHTEDVSEGVREVDFLYTDVWLSPDEPVDVWNDRVALLAEYQVSMDVIRATANPRVKFMHSLPAFHDRRTAMGERVFEYTGMDALEVTDEVFESPYSIVFDQAENRVHAIKAVLVATLGD